MRMYSYRVLCVSKVAICTVSYSIKELDNLDACDTFKDEKLTLLSHFANDIIALATSSIASMQS